MLTIPSLLGADNAPAAASGPSFLFNACSLAISFTCEFLYVRTGAQA